MAVLTTPRMNIVGVFDANYAHTFTFSYLGSSQATKNKIIIKNAETYATIYEDIILSIKLSHTIPANTLKNGVNYLAQVQVYDAEENSSNFSELISFSCHTNPVFEFANVTNGTVLAVSNFETSVVFSQAEGDSIKEYIYYLYDTNKSLIGNSDAFYSLSNYTYYGLDNLTNYYIRAVGKSNFGFEVDTGYIGISVQYIAINPNLVASLKNDNGKLLIDTNIITNDYIIDGDVAIVEKEMVITPGSQITYNLSHINDFMLTLRGHDLPVDKIATVTFENGTADIFIVRINDSYMVKLEIKDGYGDIKYTLYEDIISQFLAASNGAVLKESDGKLIRIINDQADMSATIVIILYKQDGLFSLEALYS